MSFLRNKIIMFTCFFILIILFLVGAIGYSKIKNVVINKSFENLAKEAKLSSLRFKASYDRMKNDVFIVLHTPPIQGIIRSRENRGIDPNDGSTINLWKTRLETIFSSIMLHRNSYTQMRFIGVEEGGKEIARVNRVGKEKLESVLPRNLQKKGQEKYFKDALKLKRNEIYFSEITYNKEHGVFDIELVPTLRVVAPVYNRENDTLFGTLVLNANYDKLMKKAFEDILPTRDIFLIDYLGDYIEYSNGNMKDIELKGQYSKNPPPFISQITQSDKKESYFIKDGKIAYFVSIPLNSYKSDSFIRVVLVADVKEIINEEHGPIKKLLLSLFAISFISFVATTWISFLLSKKSK